MTTSAPTTFAGAPCDDPAWRSITLGQYVFPGSLGFDSTLDVDVDEELKIDDQKAAGKDKSKTKVNGVEPTKATLTIGWTYRIWDTVRAFTIGISPNGPSKGTPLDVIHPELNDRGVSKVIVKKAGKRERVGPRNWKQTFELHEWVDPGTASTGPGTQTPKKADNWGDGTGNADGTQNGKGYSGPNAPKAAYAQPDGS